MGFVQIAAEDFVISTEAVTNTCWSNNNPTLTEFFTSSIQIATNTGQFYYSVNQLDTTNSESAVQFDVAYCDKQGSGSIWYNPAVPGYSPTRTNYGQYRSLILGDEENSFVFGNQSASYFYALPIERSGYKEELLPGVMTLCLSGSGASDHLYLTDDSKLGGAAVFSEAGRIYNLVSGSAGTVYTGVDANGWTANSG